MPLEKFTIHKIFTVKLTYLSSTVKDVLEVK